MKRRQTPSGKLLDDLKAAIETMKLDHGPGIVPQDQCALLQHQMNELTELATAAEDIDEPDKQARERLVKLAALALYFAEEVDAHIAKAGRVPHGTPIDTQQV